MNRVMGSEADCLWGPELDLMVKAPPSLANIQALGAARRFRCFLGPRGMMTLSSEKTDLSSNDEIEQIKEIKYNFCHSKLSP